MMSLCILRGRNDAQLAPSDPETSVLTHLLADSSGTLLDWPNKKLDTLGQLLRSRLCPRVLSGFEIGFESTPVIKGTT